MPYGTRSTGPVRAQRASPSSTRRNSREQRTQRSSAQRSSAQRSSAQRSTTSSSGVETGRSSRTPGSEPTASSTRSNTRRSRDSIVALASGSSSSDGSSNSRTRSRETPASAAASSSNVDAETLRMMKRMRPDELRELSKVAAALEKSKLEDEKKVADFVAKTPDFVVLVDDCYVCLEPLLNNLGTPKFGVMSWHCRCTVAQKAHSACVFSKICRGQSSCDMCSSPMLFENTRGKRTETTISFFKKKRRGRSSREHRAPEIEIESAGALRDSSVEEEWVEEGEEGDETDDGGPAFESDSAQSLADGLSTYFNDF